MNKEKAWILRTIKDFLSSGQFLSEIYLLKKMDLLNFFGSQIDLSARKDSYHFIEGFIEDQVKDWTSSPDTNAISDLFAREIKTLSDPSFAFLLSHNGYIPEFYDHDSSQETLFTKLIEVLVCEWALRIGFIDSHIQRQKASKEDVTIKGHGKIIVCDAKSYRLGRSQGAPNVKDTIKKADYEKWLSYYDQSQSLGGLISFPSLHRWKRASDAYLYCTDKEKPIMILGYEEMAFCLLKKISSSRIIQVLESYSDLFSEPSRNQASYWKAIHSQLFEGYKQEWLQFEMLMSQVVAERVSVTLEKIDHYLLERKGAIRKDVESIPTADLIDRLVESNYRNECGQLMKNLVNIKKFRQ